MLHLWLPAKCGIDFLSLSQRGDVFMKKKSIIKFLVIYLVAATLFLGGCQASSSSGDGDKDAEDTITVTDMLGRKVTVKKDVKKVVAIGPGSLRLYFYVGEKERLVGIEQFEKDNTTGKPYLLANKSILELPVIGLGGPNNSPDAEKLLAVRPDVIFTTYTTEKSAADELQAKTHTPVIALSYGDTAVFDPVLYQSLNLIGTVISEQDRAQEVVGFFKDAQKDLNNRTKNVIENEKFSTYIGGLGYRGAHGITSTRGNYVLFDAVNAINVVDETGRSGSVMIDKEKLLQWNPDKIFIDLNGLALVVDDYKKNLNFYQSLSAIEKGEVYAQLPYNYYSTNIDTAMANAYYIGKVIYPEQFTDIDPEKKADEIYEFLLGQKLYNEMVEDIGGGFGEIKIDNY